MTLQFTSSTIKRTDSTTITICNRGYNASSTQTVPFSRYFPQTGCIGHNGVVYQSYIQTDLDDNLVTSDYYLIQDQINTVFSFRMDVVGQVYNFSTSEPIGSVVGTQWCTARWDSGGTLSLTNRSYAGVTYSATVGTTTAVRWTVTNTDGLTRASCMVADNNILVVRQRKVDLTNADYVSTVSSYIMGTSTYERGALMDQPETTNGHHNGYY